MKKILCILLVVFSLFCTGCNCSEFEPETVEKHADGSYIVSNIEKAPGSDGSIALTKERRLCFITVNEEGEKARAVVSLNAEQQELLSDILGQAHRLTYPKLERQPDGTLEVITVDENGNPVEKRESIDLLEILGDIDIVYLPYKENRITYPTLILNTDGSYHLVMMGEDGKPVERTKTATKVSRFYSADGTLQWTMAVTATFTYDGLSVTCSGISSAITIADTDSWYLIEEIPGEACASLCATFGRVTLGVTTSTPTFTLELRCDKAGNLS